MGELLTFVLIVWAFFFALRVVGALVGATLILAYGGVKRLWKLIT